MLAKHLWQWLTPDEQKRFHGYKLAIQRTRHLLSRALLRQVLAERLACKPKDLIFECSAKGKPSLKEPTSSLAFNLSHSGNWIALGVADCETLGIDIEHPHKKRSFIDIAESYFHPEEVKILHSLKNAEQSHYFHSLWTLKESFFKARGTGITEGLDKIAFEIRKDKILANINASLKEKENLWRFKQWHNPLLEMNKTENCYLALSMKNSCNLTPKLHYTLPSVYCRAV